jgi:hypothetical protein
MSKRIRIKAGVIEAIAELNDSETAQKIGDSLPIKGRVNLWGDEIYFSVPLILKLENGQTAVNVGDMGYWPQGNAFCIFFGPTPISTGNQIRPASAVTVFGRIIGDTAVFKKVAPRTEIIIEALSA